MPEVMLKDSGIIDLSIDSMRSIKIMVVGSDHKAAMEHHYIKYFEEFHIPHSLFPAQGMFYEYYEASLLNKITFKLGIASIYKRINEELIAEVEARKPNVLFVFKGMEIFPSTLEYVRRLGIKLV